ncbi:unnamed protein product [Effrenium voratum]|nr:unnamed protein product [Effrenium voratum]
MSGKVRVLHLLCKNCNSRNPVSRRTGESTASVSVESAHAELKAIMEKLNGKSGQDLVDAFAKEAQARSDCGSYAQGGDLGHFGPGEMQKEFEEASFKLEVGQMSGIIDSQSGSHIILRGKLSHVDDSCMDSHVAVLPCHLLRHRVRGRKAAGESASTNSSCIYTSRGRRGKTIQLTGGFTVHVRRGLSFLVAWQPASAVAVLAHPRICENVALFPPGARVFLPAPSAKLRLLRCWTAGRAGCGLVALRWLGVGVAPIAAWWFARASLQMPATCLQAPVQLS